MNYDILETHINIIFSLYAQVAPNAALRADYFQTQEVHNICISIQIQTDIVVFYLKF